MRREPVDATQLVPEPPLSISDEQLDLPVPDTTLAACIFDLSEEVSETTRRCFPSVDIRSVVNCVTSVGDRFQSLPGDLLIKMLRIARGDAPRQEYESATAFSMNKTAILLAQNSVVRFYYRNSHCGFIRFISPFYIPICPSNHYSLCRKTNHFDPEKKYHQRGSL